ncbi:MAG: penicillin-binding protein 2 [Patescibacteria group bacterium]|nr:penicillin-binding protein 2 [Patescibacteria group bacterium]MDD4304451.1 penicillin-binding protein 2 [Patescibacteria group bacterium]MDD4695474.1 penicillin-binding protein 2 [Patescibacteria group bacterium]
MDFFEISDFNFSEERNKKSLNLDNYELNNSIGGFIDTFSSGPVKSLGVIINRNKFLFLIVLISLFAFITFGRLFYLQLVEGGYYRSLADGNRIRIKRIEPNRGIIYDNLQKPLLKNSPSFSLQIIPVDLPKDKEDLLKLQEQINKKLGDTDINLSDYLSDNILENFQPRIIKESISYEQAMDLMVFSNDINGLSIVINNKREYPYIGYFSHLFGYMGDISENEYKKLKDSGYYLDDKIGKSGLEFIYENSLKGIFGKKKIEVDSVGKEIKELAVEQPVDGKNLLLHLDGDLQLTITNLLADVLKKYNLKKASVVAVDPNDGGIMAIVSTPTFDNNLFSEKLTPEIYNSLMNDPDKPMFFRAVSGEYPPGSTFKLVMASAALEAGTIDKNTTFLSTGGIHIGQWFFPDWKYGGHGATNVIKAIAESVNTFFYNIGGGYNEFQGLGLEKIDFYADQFGLSKKLGIDLPNEASGFLPTENWKEEVINEPWYIGDTYHLSIGQGYALVTPLQVAMFTSAIANGGTLYSPQVVDKMFDKNFVYEINLQILNSNFISKENISIIEEGMNAATKVGSCRYLSTLPFESAGKTGTAQFGTENKTHAWFTGYAPYNNPEMVLTIIIEGGGEGSSVAVPLARDIFLWYFKDRLENDTSL